ncbi:MAG: DUF559 domain-containing protein [Actinobacteria bacterium]|nr:DUF559 domain-containing protein [Actinomycetota bacterium]
MDERAFGELASAQQGVVSRAQAMKLGCSTNEIAHRVAVGRWLSVGDGVYRVAGSPTSWLLRLWTAVLEGGDGSAVSHRAAAQLWGIRRYGDPVEILTPRPRRLRTSDVVVHTSAKFDGSDIAEMDGLPVTTVERTLMDLGAVVHWRQVEHALEAALRDKLTTLSAIDRRLSVRRGRGRSGVGVLANILTERVSGPVAESTYEREFLRLVEPLAVLPPQAQHEIRAGDRFVARVDAAWPDARVAVEIDGHRFHATRSQRASDARRQNELELLGWKVLRFTTDQVHTEPVLVSQTVLAALRSRSRDGSTGLFP